ncbi:uncharacterized protein [Argopecten irradians]|uniref:uncharacterized protein n=1 Tax=Argopecten irradians TaxID=31199 RepID=UPI00370FB0BF
MAAETITHRLFGALNSEDLKEAEALLKASANPNDVLPVEGVACMHIASGLGLEATKLLLCYGGDPNIRSVDGTTPMHVATTWGDLDSLRILLLNGGDPLARDQEGNSCLDCAQSYGHTNCTKLLELYILMLTPDADSSQTPNIVYKPCESVDDLHIDSDNTLGRKYTKEDSLDLEDFLEWALDQDAGTYTNHINKKLRSHLTGHRNYSCDVTSPDHPFLEIKSQNQESDISGQTDTNDLGFCQNSCHVHWADELTKTLPWDSILDNSLTNSTDDDTFLSCSSGPSPTHKDGNSQTNLLSSSNGSSLKYNNNVPAKIKGKITLLPNSSGPDPRDKGQTTPLFCSNSGYLKGSDTTPANSKGQKTLMSCSSYPNSSCSSDTIPANSKGQTTLQNTNSKTFSGHLNEQSCGNCNKVRGTFGPSPLQNLEKKKVRCDRKVQNWLNSTSPQTLVEDMRKISLESKPIHTWKPPSLPVDQNTSDLISLDESFCQRHAEKSSNIHMSSLKESFNDSLLTDQDETIPYDYHAEVEAQKSSRTSTLTEGSGDSAQVESDDTLLYDEATSVTDCDILNQSFDQVSVDSGVTVDYVYRDPEEGIVLVERRIPSQCGSTGSTQRLSFESTGTMHTLDSQATQIYDWKSLCKIPGQRKSDASDLDEVCSVHCEEIPANLRSLSNDNIRSRLQLLGDNPGPVTAATRQTYLIRLQQVERDPQLVLTTKGPGYSSALQTALEGNYDSSLSVGLETKMVAAFQNPRRTCRWREGTMKSSFNYLLLDPRVTRNLPNRCCSLSELDTFRTFVSAIFYVGKGKRARPYCHLYEAINQLKSPKDKVSEKIERILDIWSSGEGVVSLHCFQSVIPVEAYTREACMVDAIGLSNLTNKKKGDYYGVSTTWSNKQRQHVGVLLLKKALQIFLGEGERQISPPDIKIGS